MLKGNKKIYTINNQEELAHDNMSIFNDFVFNNTTNVYVIKRNNEPWFCGLDVGKALGFHIPDMYHMLPENEKMSISASNLTIYNANSQNSYRGFRLITFISLSGLFRIIALSRSPEAIAFQNWVNSVVLPSIYNTRYYAAPNTREQINNDPKILEEYNKKIAELEKQNEKYKKQIKSSSDIMREHYKDKINSRFISQTQGNNLIKAVNNINIRIDMLSNMIEKYLNKMH